MVNKVYNEECLVTLKNTPRDTFDLVITSPPYEDIRTYTGESKFDFPYFMKMAHELYRTVKPGGVICWIVGDQVKKYNNGNGESGMSFRQALHFIEAGFVLFDTMIYQKAGIAFPDPRRYYQSFEYIFVLSKGNPKTINRITDRKNSEYGKKIHSTQRTKDGTFKPKSGAGKVYKEYGVRTNIWRYPVEYNGSQKDRRYIYDHPAVFPEALCNDLMISYSNTGDIVYDPFMGSGTVAYTAIINNRNYIGSEISQKYCDIITKRIASAKKVKLV